jgi:hypothetical protein
MDNIDKIAKRIVNDGLNTDIDQTIKLIDDLLYKLQNAVRQQKAGYGINIPLINSTILGIRNNLDVVNYLLYPQVEERY